MLFCAIVGPKRISHTFPMVMSTNDNNNVNNIHSVSSKRRPFWIRSIIRHLFTLMLLPTLSILLLSYWLQLLLKNRLLNITFLYKTPTSPLHVFNVWVGQVMWVVELLVCLSVDSWPPTTTINFLCLSIPSLSHFKFLSPFLILFIRSLFPLHSLSLLIALFWSLLLALYPLVILSLSLSLSPALVFSLSLSWLLSLSLTLLVTLSLTLSLYTGLYLFLSTLVSISFHFLSLFTGPYFFLSFFNITLSLAWSFSLLLFLLLSFSLSPGHSLSFSLSLLVTPHSIPLLSLSLSSSHSPHSIPLLSLSLSFLVTPPPLSSSSLSLF